MSDERLRRWRLVLGGDRADGTGVPLDEHDRDVDGALDAVYRIAAGWAGWERVRRSRAGSVHLRSSSPRASCGCSSRMRSSDST